MYNTHIWIVIEIRRCTTQSKVVMSLWSKLCCQPKPMCKRRMSTCCLCNYRQRPLTSDCRCAVLFFFSIWSSLILFCRNGDMPLHVADKLPVINTLVAAKADVQAKNQCVSLSVQLYSQPTCPTRPHSIDQFRKDPSAVSVGFEQKEKKQSIASRTLSCTHWLEWVHALFCKYSRWHSRGSNSFLYFHAHCAMWNCISGIL
jgi:hypothetical protein